MKKIIKQSLLILSMSGLSVSIESSYNKKNPSPLRDWSRADYSQDAANYSKYRESFLAGVADRVLLSPERSCECDTELTSNLSPVSSYGLSPMSAESCCMQDQAASEVDDLDDYEQFFYNDLTDAPENEADISELMLMREADSQSKRMPEAERRREVEIMSDAERLRERERMHEAERTRIARKEARKIRLVQQKLLNQPEIERRRLQLERELAERNEIAENARRQEVELSRSANARRDAEFKEHQLKQAVEQKERQLAQAAKQREDSLIAKAKREKLEIQKILRKQEDDALLAKAILDVIHQELERGPVENVADKTVAGAKRAKHYRDRQGEFQAIMTEVIGSGFNLRSINSLGDCLRLVQQNPELFNLLMDFNLRHSLI